MLIYDNYWLTYKIMPSNKHISSRLIHCVTDQCTA